MEWLIAKPMGNFLEDELPVILEMPEQERIELLASLVQDAAHSRDCFLAHLFDDAEFFVEASADEEFRLRCWRLPRYFDKGQWRSHSVGCH